MLICVQTYTLAAFIYWSLNKKVVLRKTRKHFIIRANFNSEVMILQRNAQSELFVLSLKQ